MEFKFDQDCRVVNVEELFKCSCCAKVNRLHGRFGTGESGGWGQKPEFSPTASKLKHDLEKLYQFLRGAYSASVESPLFNTFELACNDLEVIIDGLESSSACETI